MLANADYQTDKNLAEGVIAMGEDGPPRHPQLLAGNDRDAARNAGKFDWQVFRNDSELITVVQDTEHLAPVGPQTSYSTGRGLTADVDLLPFEQAAGRQCQQVHRIEGRGRARRPDEAVSEDLHRECLLGRPHPVSGRADHQQALRQHPAGRPDLHVQLGRR